MGHRGGAVATRERRQGVALELDCLELQSSQANQGDRDIVEAAELFAHAGHVRRYYPHDRSLMRWADWFLRNDLAENGAHHKQRTLARDITGRISGVHKEKATALVDASTAASQTTEDSIVAQDSSDFNGAAA